MGLFAFELAITIYFATVIIGFVDVIKAGRSATRLMMLVAALGLAVHTVSIAHRYLVGGHLPIASPHEAASFFAWCIVVLFFALEYRYRLGLLGSFVMPVVFLLMLAAAMLSKDIKPLSPVLQSNWLGVHTFFAFMGNAAFALAAALGIMYLVQEHYLKTKHLGELFTRLPDIQTLDYVGYRLISIGFPLLTLAMISGAVWANSAWGSYWRWDPRETWSLITWLIYAMVLHARLVAGWRGRRASILSIVGFATIILAFFGIKLLQRGLHVF